jgi:flagellar basal-body rod protein FlgF/flagellar basal-body rod protein FlgG
LICILLLVEEMDEMDSGYYAAMTGLVARTQALDIAATNLANATTPGYRSEQEYFRSALLGPDASDSQLGRTVNNYGLLGGDRLSLVQGTIEQTGNPLDLAIEGEGFFQVQTPNGPRYTRDGGFHRAQSGQLVTAAGDPVLSSTGQLIPVPPGEVSVGSNGVLSVAGGVVATVGVFTFPSGAELTPDGANHYLAPPDVTAIVSKNAAIRQGAIENANQSAIAGSLNLVLMQREAEMMQRALTVFHTEFNKIATEDLPRV